LVLLSFLFFFTVPALGGPATASSTVVTTSSKTVNSRTITVLSAIVTDPNTVMQGLVRFYDGTTLIGTGQIVNTGTKYSHGTANLSVELAPGTHTLKAVFAGTTAAASSASATKTVTIGGGSTSTTISATGAAGNYTLTGQVVTSSALAPTGQVSFVDQTTVNAVLGLAPLGAGTSTLKFAKAVPYSIYDPTDYYTPQQVVVADFNGDGILDFAEVDYAARISIHLGNGDGTFQAAKPFCTTGTPPVPCQAGSEPDAIATGDFNSDGIPDLVVQDGANVDVMLGNGDGTFKPEVVYGTANGNTNIVVADLNLDGTPDLAVTVEGGVSILLGNGDGTFQPHNDVGLNDSSTYLTVGDFNKDGIPDLAVDGWNGDTVMVLLGNGDGTFKAEKDTTIDVNPADGTIVAADFKGTGFLCDLALSGNDTLEALVGNGDGTFKAPQELKPNTTFDEYVGGFVVADLNGDGIPDMALTWYSSDTDVGRVGVFYGNGDGTFNATPTTLSVGEEPVSIAAGDFDGNGAVDLVVANMYDSTLSVLLDTASNIATATLTGVAVPGVGTQNVLASYAGDSAHAASTSATIALTGSGTVPALSADSLGFGSTAAGTSSAPQSVTVTNPGTTALAITSIAVTGTNASQFVFANSCGTSLAAGASCVIHGHFQPTTAGTMTAAVTITDSAINSPQNIALSGTGIAVPAVGLTAASLSFGATTVGTSSASQQVTLTNTGGAALTITSIALTGTNASQFVFANNCGTSVAVGATCIIHGHFQPTTAGAMTAAVTITDNASNSPQSIALSGTGVASGAPVLTSMSPSTTAAGGAAFTLSVYGTGFVTGAIVKFNGNARTTALVSATQVNAAILATDIGTAGSYSVTVSNGTSVSNALTFTVTPAANPAVLTSISPSYTTVGGPAFTLTVTGTNFATGAVVNWGTAALTTAFVSATQVNAAVPAADIAAVGDFAIMVNVPGAATSNSLTFTVAPVTHTPLAYGFFTQTGAAGATSGNITCAWTSPEYLCTVTGENFFYSKYVVNVTAGDINTPAVATVNSISGQIIVKIYNLSGTAIQDPFYITVFKP
jgi:hypothetical protein